MKPKYVHYFLVGMFGIGAMLTGFGHDAEILALGIVVIGLMVYIVGRKYLQ